MESKLNDFDIKQTNELFIHNSDPPLIKKVKNQGNKILKNNAGEIPAWRIDFSLLFEKFIQYIFRRISKEIGARQYENYKIHRLPGYNAHALLKY